MSRIGIRRYRTPALLLVGMAVVFVADVSTPLGIAVWLLYLPFVLATLYVIRRARRGSSRLARRC